MIVGDIDEEHDTPVRGWDSVAAGRFLSGLSGYAALTGNFPCVFYAIREVHEGATARRPRDGLLHCLTTGECGQASYGAGEISRTFLGVQEVQPRNFTEQRVFGNAALLITLRVALSGAVYVLRKVKA